MIKATLILLLAWIIITDAANGITVSVSMATNMGGGFSDQITMSGDVAVHGQYILNPISNAIGASVKAQVGSVTGSFAEDTNVHVMKNALHVYKAINNKGNGAMAYSSMQLCLVGHTVQFNSGLQADSGVDNGEIKSLFRDEAGMHANAFANWHHENVESVTGLVYDGNNLAITPLTIGIANTPFSVPNGFQKG